MSIGGGRGAKAASSLTFGGGGKGAEAVKCGSAFPIGEAAAGEPRGEEPADPEREEEGMEEALPGDSVVSAMPKNGEKDEKKQKRLASEEDVRERNKESRKQKRRKSTVFQLQNLDTVVQRGREFAQHRGFGQVNTISASSDAHLYELVIELTVKVGRKNDKRTKTTGRSVLRVRVGAVFLDPSVQGKLRKGRKITQTIESTNMSTSLHPSVPAVLLSHKARDAHARLLFFGLKFCAPAPGRPLQRS